jgi:ElaB/YqjD/DUF883 family membrane-anchored ribosome-binding protein
MLCLAGYVAESVVETLADLARAAAEFVKNNPWLVVGVTVLVLGVLMIAVAGPGGTIILVAA